MRRWLVVLSILFSSAGAMASSVVVYPFDSQDTLLGVAVADRVAGAFEGEATVVGPDVAPGLLPPLVANPLHTLSISRRRRRRVSKGCPSRGILSRE